MAHIRYGDRNYTIADDQVEAIQKTIHQALTSKGVAEVDIYEEIDGKRYPTRLYITQGVPVSVHEWDTNAL